MENKQPIFQRLNNINVNGFTEKKQGLTYLSWAHAWREVKILYPEAIYKVQKDEDGLPYIGTPKIGYMCYTTVTIEGITHEMWLPVMNGSNKAMKEDSYTYTVKGYNGGKAVEKTVEPMTMFDVNKTLMRCLTKNLAMFGLGIYIYAGEDLPIIYGLPESLLKHIKTITKLEKLSELYKIEINNFPQQKDEFIKALAEQKAFIIETEKESKEV